MSLTLSKTLANAQDTNFADVLYFRTTATFLFFFGRGTKLRIAPRISGSSF